MSSMDLNHIVVSAKSEKVLIGWSTRHEAEMSAARYRDNGTHVYVTTKQKRAEEEQAREQANEVLDTVDPSWADF